MVPSSEKRAVFWEMGSSCPLHSAQPLGAKVYGKTRISATNGSISAHLREDAEERDDERQREVGLEVRVRLRAAGGADRLAVQRRVGHVVGVELHVLRDRRHPVGGRVVAA